MLTYHPTAKTTYKIREAISKNVDKLNQRQLSQKYNVSQRTIIKWQHRASFKDAKMGAINPKKSITDIEEYVICEIRKISLLPLDDLLDVVTGLGIKITRSALHRALQRNELSNIKKYLSSLNEAKTKQHSNFKEYKAGYIHIDIKYLPKINGVRRHLYVAIDRSTRVVFADIYADKTATSTNRFLKNAIDFFPFEIYKVLTDNGKEFTDKFSNRSKQATGKHLLDKTCADYKIEHRLTKPYTPKTNGMVERVNNKVVANVLDRIQFKTIEQLKRSIFHYFYSYNHHIKHSRIGRKTPIQALEEIYKRRADNGVRFRVGLDGVYLNSKLFPYDYIVGCDN